MIDDAAYARGEKVEESLTELIDRRHVQRVESGEISIKQLLDQRAEKKRQRRQSRNRDLWQQHHLSIAESLRTQAEALEARAAELAEGEA